MARDRDLCLPLQVYFWYPLNVITGGTTAKIMLAAKDNFLGKYIYKDTLARNLAAVIYKVINAISSSLLLSSHTLNLQLSSSSCTDHVQASTRPQKLLMVLVISN
jgi:hypothetical protein